LPSRLVVFGVAAWVTVAGLPTAAPDVVTSLEHPFTGWPGENLLDLIFSPLAKWDSLHYLSIAYDGYVGGHSGLTDPAMRPAFFPLYPGIVRVLSGFAASPGLLLIVAYAVSLACFFAALVLLHRLTTIEIGERYARPTLLLLCFFPTSFFFGIPYSESLFLLLAVAAFLAARTGRWAIAGAVLALASATRAPGLLLIVPVALLYLYGPRADRRQASAPISHPPESRLAVAGAIGVPRILRVPALRGGRRVGMEPCAVTFRSPHSRSVDGDVGRGT
jgi:hypothetical protein